MGGRGSGGARPNSGPAGDPNALRRNRDSADWTILPAAGRLDPAPEWPDDVPAPSKEELVRWRTLWALPQAKIWEADHIFDQVALYVRVWVEAMQPGGASTTRVLAKQLQNELLLSAQSLASAKYVVAGTNEAAAITAAMNEPGTVTPITQQGSARSRFNVVGNPGPDPSAVAPSEDEDDEDEPGSDDDGPQSEIPF
jgi:hypothetical protein